jgi:hypothetical protein
MQFAFIWHYHLWRCSLVKVRAGVVHSTVGQVGISRTGNRLNIEMGYRGGFPRARGGCLAGERRGNHRGMSPKSHPADPPDVWAEAAIAIQAEQDADIRLEARGLAVAEMADVTFAERLAALIEGEQVTVILRRGTRVSGRVIHPAPDHLLIADSFETLVPVHAIAAITDVPRVLHTESQGKSRPRGWRSVLRGWWGETIQVNAAGAVHTGKLTWIGKDHLSIRSLVDHDDDVTIPWQHIDAISQQVS